MIDSSAFLSICPKKDVVVGNFIGMVKQITAPLMTRGELLWSVFHTMSTAAFVKMNAKRLRSALTFCLSQISGMNMTIYAKHSGGYLPRTKSPKSGYGLMMGQQMDLAT